MDTRGKAALLAAVLLLASALTAVATPEFAATTGKACAFCHAGANGGPLSHVGVAFVRNGYHYPIPERILDKSILLSAPLHKTVRLILGILHLLTAAILAGTIFYIHIIVRPHSLKGGVPLGEKRLGLTCMSILAATGVYLTWYRIDSPASFFQSRFGVLLFIKILLFVIMAALGVLAVTLITRKMREKLKEAPGGSGGTGAPGGSGAPGGLGDLASPSAHAPSRSSGGGFDPRELRKYDGNEGRPAYVAFRNKVYDVSGSPKWREGAHFRAHTAGEDLTAKMESAPHGEEVLERYPVVAELPDAAAAALAAGDRPRGVRKLYIVLAYVNLALVFLILLCVGGWLWGFRLGRPPVAEAAGTPGTLGVAGVRATRGADWRLAGLGVEERSCLECHRGENPGIFADWHESVHGKVGVSCRDCHAVNEPGADWISRAHLEHSETPVSGLVSPERCSMCHEQEVEEYQRSKHANTLRIINTIDNWMIHGMNNETERSSGCLACHGTTVAFQDGVPVEGSWPNVGVGRANPDGSLGSCTSCHTRHSFSVEEARKPEACDQCHLGPDHPQIEIYNESKHGTIYHAEGDSWDWRPEDFSWTAGEDYRAPTCASCHMSEAPGVPRSHDVTGRLAWELQAPLTIRPSEFEPFPAPTDWREERNKMRAVCLQCHSREWVDGHFTNTDNVIESYNELYYRPIRAVMDRLYASGALSEDMYFDEELEWEYYEFWHHEGRRARMGAAMMAPDYAWWHGFYEVKHRFLKILDAADELSPVDRGRWLENFPGRLDQQR